MYVVANLLSIYRRGAPRVSGGHFAPPRTVKNPVCGGCGGKFRGKSIGASCGELDAPFVGSLMLGSSVVGAARDGLLPAPLLSSSLPSAPFIGTAIPAVPGAGETAGMACSAFCARCR